MKKFYAISFISAIVFMGCNDVSPQVDTKMNNAFTEVDVSKLGVENTKEKKEINISYDVNDEEEKEYRQLQKIEAENKINDEKKFKAFIREAERK